MRWSVSFLFLITILSYSNLHAQEASNIGKQAILDVFELFFKSMRERDTVTLKRIIIPSEFFFTSMKADSTDFTIGGFSGSSFKGFIKTVGSPDGIKGKCNNEFEDFEVQLYIGFSIVTADYKCYLEKSKIENCGRYFIQFLKFRNIDSEDGFEWKIKRVDRVVLNNFECIE